MLRLQYRSPLSEAGVVDASPRRCPLRDLSQVVRRLHLDPRVCTIRRHVYITGIQGQFQLSGGHTPCRVLSGTNTEHQWTGTSRY